MLSPAWNVFNYLMCAIAIIGPIAITVMYVKGAKEQFKKLNSDD